MSEKRREMYRRVGSNFYFLGRPAEVWRKAIEARRRADKRSNG